MLKDENRMEEARKRAKAKAEFIRHLMSYLVIMAFLALINNVTGSGYQWWLWPALGWGIGIVSHFLKTYVTGGRLEEKLVDQELEKMDEE